MKYAFLTSDGTPIIIVSSFLIFLTLVFVALRFYARHIMRKELELYDHFIIVGAIFAILNAVLTIVVAVYNGAGYQLLPAGDLSPQVARVPSVLVYSWVLANTFVKLSIVHLYITIFHACTPFRRVSYGVILLICGYCITFVALNIASCNAVPGQSCSSTTTAYYASVIINMIIDFIVFALPLPSFWKLQMETKRKISLVVIFGFGFVICIISALRIQSYSNVSFHNAFKWTVRDGIYSVLEPCCGVINACLPFMHPIASKLSQSRIFASLRSSLQMASRGASEAQDQSKNTIVTIGGGGQRKRYRRLNEADPSLMTNDEDPATSLAMIVVSQDGWSAERV